MDKTKLIIYNFRKNCLSLVKYKDIVKNYDIVGVIVTDNTNFDLRDFTSLRMENNQGVRLYNDYTYILENNCDYDAIYYNFDSEYPGNIQDIFHVMRKNNKQNIIPQALLNVLKSDFPQALNKVAYDVLEDRKPLNIQDYALDYIMKSFYVPIISVYAAGELCNQLEIQLEVYKRFVNKGYKVKMISAHDLAGFFDMSLYPAFFLSPDTRHIDKIYGMNTYIKSMEDEDTDLIIIGVPGAILSLNDQSNNEFGIPSIIMSQAVPPDISILSIYIDTFNEQYYKDMANLMKYKFDSDMVYFNISDTYLECNILDRGIPMYISMNAKQCSEILSQSDIDILHSEKYISCCIPLEESVDRVVDCIINELTDSLEIV